MNRKKDQAGALQRCTQNGENENILFFDKGSTDSPSDDADEQVTPIERVLKKVKGVHEAGERNRWTGLCPAHGDTEPSLSISVDDTGVGLKCHAGCEFEEIIEALGMKATELFNKKNNKNTKNTKKTSHTPPEKTATAQQSSSGLTLEEYSGEKMISLIFLEECGLQQVNKHGKPTLRMSYRDESGDEVAVRYRHSLAGHNFSWKTDSEVCLYGLWRLPEMREEFSYVVLVEGESDCHTLWHRGIPALGIPGATNWNEKRDAPHLKGFESIYLVVENDEGGRVLLQRLSQSSIRDRLKLIDLGECKDPSELHCTDPDHFKKIWNAAVKAAVPWAERHQLELKQRKAELWEKCQHIAESDDILALVRKKLREIGVAGEGKLSKILYLALTSRLLDRIVSVIVKGPSSVGKSYVPEQVLKMFPTSAYFELTAMSARALVFSERDYRHKFLVIFEAAALDSDIMNYLLRSLLSEGRLKYAITEKTEGGGYKTREIEKEGPTGLLISTTKVRIHPENETRILSLTANDSPEQTKRVMRSIAEREQKGSGTADLNDWIAYQQWLDLQNCRVTVPYANVLADLIPPTAVRLRRDFSTIMSLIKTHALLHQATRKTDEDGTVIADISDYESIRELVEDYLGYGIEASVPNNVAEVVRLIQELSSDGNPDDTVREISISKLTNRLKLDKSSVSRRVTEAISLGYLVNLEKVTGRPARLVAGDPLPEDLEVLPSAEKVQSATAASLAKHKRV